MIKWKRLTKKYEIEKIDKKSNTKEQKDSIRLASFEPLINKDKVKKIN